MSRPLTADSGLVVIGVIDVSVGADGVVGAPGIESVTDLLGKTFRGRDQPPRDRHDRPCPQAGRSLLDGLFDGKTR